MACGVLARVASIAEEDSNIQSVSMWMADIQANTPRSTSPCR